ncbi:hypothetical protein K488DRAFT_91384 [Vararia minispora EC-137]|uniref:Uncharacterized protein n=1 Tax=Vararia minispora EC-137 TaxID=1314806 RepID=A0ACB8Q5R2_9AGAM|nr:hypothetical protein K488DRAFT_91384 [Vararia minispora EC-137]
MIPIALLGSAVYLGLELLRSSLANEKHLDDARAHAAALEAEIDALLEARAAKAGQPSGSGGAGAGMTRRWWPFA